LRVLAALTTLSSVIAMAGVDCGAAVAAFSGVNGQLAYSTPTGCFGACADGYPNSQIHLANPDGSGDHQLTFAADADTFSDWSPDGSMILFDGWRGTPSRYGIFSFDWHQYVMASDGSGAREIVCPFPCGGATWSADGQRLLVTGTNQLGENLFSLALDGTDPVQLTHTPAGTGVGNAAWSPDGRQIAYVESTGAVPATVELMNADGTGAHTVASGSTPTFSPDGKWLAYSTSPSGNSWLYLVPVDGSAQPVPIAPDPNLYEGTATFSPDGTELAFSASAAPPLGSSPGAGIFNKYILIARLPVQPPAPGGRSATCVDGYHVVAHGDVASPHWGSYQPPPGANADPTLLPCPSPVLEPPPTTSTSTTATASPALTTWVHAGHHAVTVRVMITASRSGTIRIAARERRHNLRRTKTTGPRQNRLYRFRTHGAGTVAITIQLQATSPQQSTTFTRTIRVKS
jgi:hypothetical protein